MPVKYIKLEVDIHGLSINDEYGWSDYFDYLIGWIKESTKAALLGNQKQGFNFRNEFDSDIEVKIIEFAGY
jgi:hypothetical protein